MKITILPNNKGQAVNPFANYDDLVGLHEFKVFDKANPSYEIINPLSVKVGDEISATLVWQYRELLINSIFSHTKWFNESAEEKEGRTGNWFEHRLTWQLTPVKEGEEKTPLDTPFNSERNWTEDFSHENGNYSNTCILCDKQFLGHKRRVACKICSHPAESDNSQYRIDPVGIVDEICPADITPENLKAWRKFHGFTLREVQKDTGISNPYLSQLETGKIKHPSFDVIAKLVILYGKTLIIK